jgi:hypothetical protein
VCLYSLMDIEHIHTKGDRNSIPIEEVQTEDETITIKIATWHDDVEWSLMTRGYTHRLMPHELKAPDHQRYVELEKKRAKADPGIKNFAVRDSDYEPLWEREDERAALIGFVSLSPLIKLDDAVEVGYLIGDMYKSKGHARFATRALTRYAHDFLGIGIVAADIHPLRKYDGKLLTSLGFVVMSEKPGHIIYAHEQPIDMYAQSREEAAAA